MKFPLPQERTNTPPQQTQTTTTTRAHAGGLAIAALSVAIAAAVFAVAALTLSIVNAVRLSRLRYTFLESTHNSATEREYGDKSRSTNLSSEGDERLKEEGQTCPSCDKLKRIAVIINSDDHINCHVTKDKTF